MVTAKNYAAQAERGLMEFFEFTKDIPSIGIDRRLIEKNILRHIKKAIHFAIPDEGVIIDDGWKGMRGVAFRLPYPTITIEYYVPCPPGPLNVKSDPSCIAYSPKRIVMAKEFSVEEFRELSVEEFGGHFADVSPGNCGRDSSEVLSAMPKGTTHIVMVTCAMSAPWLRKDLWVPGFVGILVPSIWESGLQDWPLPLNGLAGRGSVSNRDRSSYPLAAWAKCTTFTICPTLYSCDSLGLKGDDMENLYDELKKDCADEVSAVFELLEALTCRNVSTITREKIPPKINARRVRAGKLPLYETQVLVIDGSQDARSGSMKHTHGDRHGPRQHLRRGHIRRLTSGNIWVNSCLVGAGNQGYIEKSYAVN